MSNPNIPPYINYSEFLKNFDGLNFSSVNNLLSHNKSIVDGFRNSTELASQLNKEMHTIIKSFEIHDRSKLLNGFVVNSGIMQSGTSVNAREVLNGILSFYQNYNSDSLRRMLELDLSLYKVELNSLSNYLKSPIFDLYDLHTEFTIDSEESIEQNIDIENVEFFEDCNDVDTSSGIIVIAPYKSVLDKVKEYSIDDLDWREFEELVAELLRQQGWCVDLQRGTKDGGADIIATNEIKPIGLVRCIWQAKKYSIHNKVKLPAIKELAFNRTEFNASKAILVTTSFLTKGARDLIQRDQHVLGKKERDEVECWVSEIIRR